MADFTVNKRGQYYNLMYIGFEDPNYVFKIHQRNNVWFNTKTEVLGFISYVTKLEEFLNGLMLTSHNPKKIIRFYLKLVEAVASGLDVRSSWTIEDLGEILLKSFNTKYNEALTFCQDTLKWIEENDCNMLTDWRRFEKYNMNVNIFELDLPILTEEYEHFGEDSLDKVIKLTNDMLALLDKTKKDLVD